VRHILNQWFRKSTTTRRAPARRTRRPNLGVEALEDRRLMSVQFLNTTTLGIFGDDPAAPGVPVVSAIGQVQPGQFHDQIVVHTLPTAQGGEQVEVLLNGRTQFKTDANTQINTLVIDGRLGVDTVNVLQTLPGIAVRTQAVNASLQPVAGALGAEVVSVGNAGDLQKIRSTVDVVGASTLIVDGSAETAGHANVVLNGSSLTGLAPATITYQASSLSGLAVKTGNGADTLRIDDTPRRGATVDTNGGGDTVNIERITGDLTVRTGLGSDAVNVSPTAQNLDTVAGTLTLDAGPVTDAAAFDALKVQDRNAANFIQVADTLTSNSLTRTLIAPFTLPTGQVSATARTATVNYGGFEFVQFDASHLPTTQVAVPSTAGLGTTVNAGAPTRSSSAAPRTARARWTASSGR
jgi:hypothetical protein